MAEHIRDDENIKDLKLEALLYYSLSTAYAFIHTSRNQTFPTVFPFAFCLPPKFDLRAIAAAP